ncbi:methanethiol S-methyltransferase [Mycobacteroides abscessus]|uniref:methanethiol S-methyltransferase n=1 Tax=Mycobacteroides abscessus TaxID=36809 RepID=UPI000925B9CC|nr:methanethiol S-methyltransferase [Mycobacteroides abscessus]SHS90675.1 putative protein-S-isoprenylcysteine methyltransferase [Mycobacteroides abscessus subsp. abscessus]SHU28869.1 putative protein-S-isoprenylcysteine methyltransferase [Mycobacteroides abscessus subsp. abscessus]SHV34592.1 putative protein-S-isoprenylcysteine methyltransferase [Mycobacteroides abscessus subsp. abscessus]SHV73495.1 putative protein-S-isoprenylcysteine methyltransferase [Mycobacteroides abscessus subsp. absces
MRRVLAASYAAISYAIFLASFTYLIAFMGNFAVPRTIDNGLRVPAVEAFAIDQILLVLFLVTHSVMARPWFKHLWTQFVPSAIERSTYVLVSSLLLALLFWQWRTLSAVIWKVDWTPARTGLHALFWFGWAIVLASTFMINHFDLFGLRQVYLAWKGEPYTYLEFRTPLLYRLVRHPLMLGFIIAFWAAPTMTAGHLLFAVVTTSYILIALRFEERDLRENLGERYVEYSREVPMLVPGLRPCQRRISG